MRGCAKVSKKLDLNVKRIDQLLALTKMDNCRRYILDQSMLLTMLSNTQGDTIPVTEMHHTDKVQIRNFNDNRKKLIHVLKVDGSVYHPVPCG